VLRDQALEAGVRFEPFVDAEDENAFQYSSFSERPLRAVPSKRRDRVIRDFREEA
jgi:hypothetical protein